MKSQSRLSFLWLVFLVAACHDGLVAPEAGSRDANESGAPEFSVEASPRLNALGDWSVVGTGIYQCSTIYADRGREAHYRSGRLRLTFSSDAILAAGGRYAIFRYRRSLPGGDLIGSAECLIPYSDRGILEVIDRFGVRDQARLLLAGSPFGSTTQNTIGVSSVDNDLPCGTADNPCELDPIDVEVPRDDPPPPGGGGGGDDWGDPSCDPQWDECYDDGGGGGSGGGGDPLGNCNVDHPTEECPNTPESPPLDTDDNDDLSVAPPDCTSRNLEPEEVAWCQGDTLNTYYMNLLNGVFQQIADRCPFLGDDWTRVQGNIRLFQWEGESFGGAARAGGDWMLLSYQWIDADPELTLAHELLHLEGYRHGRVPGTSEWIQFINMERQCSGGRSAFG